jgi:DNA-binding transcriptional LysR family regulator
MLDLNRLIALREVKLQGSLTAAAESLQISVSAVSQQITKLENELERPLLEPLGRGVKLTLAAHRLIAAAENALSSLEEAESELRGSGTAPRTLRLAAFHSFQLNLLVPLIDRLARTAAYIDLEAIELDPREAVAEVSSRRADIALVDEYPGMPMQPTAGLVKLPLAQDPIEVHFPHGTSAQNWATSEANQLPWAMEAESTESFRWARSICRDLGFEPWVVFESPDFHLHARLVQAGKAAAFLPRSVLRFLPDLGTQAPGFPTDLTRQVSAVVRRGTQTRPDIEAVLESITAQYES